jgi:uncharacterized protein (DUF1499 family)
VTGDGRAERHPGRRHATSLRSLVMALLVWLPLAGCAGPGLGPVELVDPTEVLPPSRPQHHLMCPPGRCAATPDATSPAFDRPRDEVERAWLEVVHAQPRTEQLGHDPARHLYLFVQRTRLVGFPDLIAVRFLDTDTGSTLAVYSGSVYGYWDLGVNRRRIEDWLARLERALGPP